MSIALVRHGESAKNVRDEHGGPGGALTARGRRQMASVPAALAALTGATPAVVYHADARHVVESAEIVAGAWGAPRLVDRRLASIDLGILDGLSHREAVRRAPEEATALQRWREGRDSLAGLRIQAAEPFEAFQSRAHDFLLERCREGPDRLICVVGTRSILIMLKNLLVGDPSRFPEAYRAFEIGHGFEGLYGLSPGAFPT